MLLAVLPVASGASAFDDSKNNDSRDLLKTIPLSGYLTPPEDTYDFPFNVSNGQECDRVWVNVEVFSMHFFDRFEDISIELTDPDNKKVSQKE